MKKKETDNIQPQEKTNPQLDMDIVSQELSHFPNHVLCRALLVSCRIIDAMDPDRTFKLDIEADLNKRQLNEISLLALSLSSNVMQTYLDNKDQIDRELKLKVH